MSFIHFSHRIINSVYIQSIEIMPATYKISMSELNMSGGMLVASGLIGSSNLSIWIHKEKEPHDYDIMTKWIEQNLTKWIENNSLS